MLVGDSNAGQFTEPVLKAANDLGFDFQATTRSRCPFVDLSVEISTVAGFDPRPCRQYVTETMAQLRRTHPSLVVIASSSTGYLADRITWFLDPATGELARTPAAKAQLWRAGLERVLEDLGRNGIPTLVIHTVPQFPNWDVSSCPAYRLYANPAACGTSTSREDQDATNRLALEPESKAIRTAPLSSGVDFADQLCPGGRCSTNRGDNWIYRNGTHLSVGGALMLTDKVKTLVQAEARPDPSRTPGG